MSVKFNKSIITSMDMPATPRANCAKLKQLLLKLGHECSTSQAAVNDTFAILESFLSQFKEPEAPKPTPKKKK